MERKVSWPVLFMIVAAIAVVGMIAAGVLLASPSRTGNWWDGGMMGNGGYYSNTGLSPAVWILLFVSIATFVIAIGLLIRPFSPRPAAAPVAAYPIPPTSALTPAAEVAGPAPGAPVEPVRVSPDGSATVQPNSASTAEGLSELTLMKVLNEDERRMYLAVREHGGEMTQRDLVRLGVFSRPKVSRVLDRLEAKGILVREPNGMTNRVRIVGKVAR